MEKITIFWYVFEHGNICEYGLEKMSRGGGDRTIRQLIRTLNHTFPPNFTGIIHTYWSHGATAHTDRFTPKRHGILIMERSMAKAMSQHRLDRQSTRHQMLLGSPTAEPTELDLAQARFQPTAEQMSGRRTAHLEQKARAKEAEAKRIYEPVGRIWQSYGGEAIESMMEHVDLVDARYLISLHEHGGIVPRWQDCPESAHLNRSTLWRLYGWERMFSLPILVLSYPWLDAVMPDRLGEMLARLVPILRLMLPFCGGDEFTVGVLWDYVSLPQARRTAAEEGRFSHALASLMTWYAHPYTHVLLFTTALPTGAAYTNVRPYAQRGWCEAELRTCAISKCVHCMWDLAGFQPERLVGLEGMASFDALRQMMQAGRVPPLSPPQFERMLRERVESGDLHFSAEADANTVAHMYQAGFIAIFSKYRQFDPDGFFAAWAGLGWGDAEARQVAETLHYAAANCTAATHKSGGKPGGKPGGKGGSKAGAGGKGRAKDEAAAGSMPIGGVSVRLEGNAFGKVGQRLIQKACSGKCFEGVIF